MALNEHPGASLTKFVIAGLVLVGYPQVAYAYVDPGIISLLSQAIYSIIVGIIAVWILAPWKALKSLYRRIVGTEFTPRRGDKKHVSKMSDR